MDYIAEQGGTMQGIFIGAGANAEQDLLLALQEIRGSQNACEFQMPVSETGEELDPTKINVLYTSSGGTEQTIGQVPNAESCGANGGWYYDNPAAPTTITLCPSTCDVVQTDSEGSIRVVVGCSTQPA